MTADLAELKKGLWPYFAALYFKKNILFLALNFRAYVQIVSNVLKSILKEKKLDYTIRQILPSCLETRQSSITSANH